MAAQGLPWSRDVWTVSPGIVDGGSVAEWKPAKAQAHPCGAPTFMAHQPLDDQLSPVRFSIDVSLQFKARDGGARTLCCDRTSRKTAPASK